MLTLWKIDVRPKTRYDIKGARFRLLTILAKYYILDIWLGSEYDYSVVLFHILSYSHSYSYSYYTNRQMLVSLCLHSEHGKIQNTKTPCHELYIRTDKYDSMYKKGKQLKKHK